MDFISTRGGGAPVSAPEAALLANASDGGLYIPAYMPRRFEDGSLAILAWLSHGRRFSHVMEMFWENASLDDLVTAAGTAFGAERFGEAKAVAVTEENAVSYFRGWQDQGDFGYSITGILPPLLQLCGKHAPEAAQPENPDARLWPHVLSQAVCVISAYCEMVLRRHIRFGVVIDVEAPAETIDAITGVWIARVMGAPIRRILCRDAGAAVRALIQDGVAVETGNVERLVCSLSDAGAADLAESVAREGAYKLPELWREQLQQGLCLAEAAEDANEVRRLVLT